MKLNPKQSYGGFRQWLQHWTEIHKEMLHVPESNEHFLLTSTSWMQHEELMSKQTDKTSPCVLYNTDIRVSQVPNEDTFRRTHILYIAVLSTDMVQEYDKMLAKEHALSLAMQLIAWFKVCKIAKCKDIEHGYLTFNINSETPILNGWELVSMIYEEILPVPCFSELDYEEPV